MTLNSSGHKRKDFINFSLNLFRIALKREKKQRNSNLVFHWNYKIFRSLVFPLMLTTITEIEISFPFRIVFFTNRYSNVANWHRNSRYIIPIYYQRVVFSCTVRVFLWLHTCLYRCFSWENQTLERKVYIYTSWFPTRTIDVRRKNDASLAFT